MTFQNIFKSNFLERIASFSMMDAVAALLIAFALGLAIFVVYRKTYSGVMYNAGFGISLIALPMITAFVILAVTSNVVLSLGMVGALSIVRFRTAVKEPMDIVFLFWSIAVGIVLGAGFIPLAVFGSVLIGFILTVFSRVKFRDEPYILVVHCDMEEGLDGMKKQIDGIVRSSTRKYAMKSITQDRQRMEIIYEVRVGEDSGKLTDAVRKLEQVTDVSLINYSGEYM